MGNSPEMLRQQNLGRALAVRRARDSGGSAASATVVCSLSASEWGFVERPLHMQTINEQYV